MKVLTVSTLACGIILSGTVLAAAPGEMLRTGAKATPLGRVAVAGAVLAEPATQVLGALGDRASSFISGYNSQVSGRLDVESTTRLTGSVDVDDSALAVGGVSMSRLKADSAEIQDNTRVNGSVDLSEGSVVDVGGVHLRGVSAGGILVTSETRTGPVSANNSTVRLGGVYGE